MSKFAEFGMIRESVKNDLTLALGVMQMAELTGCSWQEIVSGMGFKPVEGQPQKVSGFNSMTTADAVRLRKSHGELVRYDPLRGIYEKYALFVGREDPAYKEVAEITGKRGGERKMVYKPEMVWGRVVNTNLPMDGCTLCFTSWGHDNHESWHLHSWNPEDDAAVMQTMFFTEMEAGICEACTLEEFARIWDAGEWEPDGVFCLPKDRVEVIEGMQEGQE